MIKLQSSSTVHSSTDLKPQLQPDLPPDSTTRTPTSLLQSQTPTRTTNTELHQENSSDEEELQRSDRAVPDPCRRRGPRRPARPARARRGSPTRSRARAGSTASRSTICGSSSTTGATSYDWRAAGGRARTSSSTSARRIDGQSIHFVHARSPHADAVPAAADARLAGLDRRVPRRDPAAHASRGARRRRRRRVPRGRAVAARLRLLGADAARAAGTCARIARAFVELMARLGYAALRRAGRRLGRAGHDPDRRVRSGALRGDPSQHADRRARPPTRSTLDRRRAGRPRRARALPARGVGLRASSRRPSRRRSASRSTTRPPGCSRGSSRSSAPGATATATPRTRSRATSCSPT